MEVALRRGVATARRGSGATALAFAEPTFAISDNLAPPPAKMAVASDQTKTGALSEGWFGTARRSPRAPRLGCSAATLRINSSGGAKSVDDQLLFALAVDRADRSLRHDDDVDHRRRNDCEFEGLDHQRLVDEPLALALAEWQ